jgi:hypothetical protein
MQAFARKTLAQMVCDTGFAGLCIIICFTTMLRTLSLHAAGTTMSGPGGVVPVEGAELVNPGGQLQGLSSPECSASPQGQVLLHVPQWHCVHGRLCLKTCLHPEHTINLQNQHSMSLHNMFLLVSSHSFLCWFCHIPPHCTLPAPPPGERIMAQVTDVHPIAPGTHISAGNIGAIPVDLGGDGLAHTGQGVIGTECVTRSHDTHHTMGSHTTHEGHAAGVGGEGKEPLGHKIKKMIPGETGCQVLPRGCRLDRSVARVRSARLHHSVL